MPVTDRSFGVNDLEQPANLLTGKSRDNSFRRRWDLHFVERVFRNYFFVNQPGVEASETAQIAIYGMTQQVSILNWCKPMLRETFRMLQIGYVFPDFLLGDIG